MKRIVRNILIVIGTVLITALIFISVLYICLLHSFSRDYLDDIEIVTPAGNYSLVVKEWGFLRGGGAEIYYKQDDNLVLQNYSEGDRKNEGQKVFVVAVCDHDVCHGVQLQHPRADRGGRDRR